MNFEHQSQTMPQKQRITVPPTQYDLKNHTYEQICSFINQQITWGAYTTPEAIDAVTTFLETIKLKYNSGFTMTYGYIPAPPYSEVTRRVIGTNGYFFKMTTTLSGVDFIWHDRITNMFLFWGASVFKVVKAMNSIRWRIQKCYSMPPLPPNRVEYQQVEDISDDDDDDDDQDDIPDLIDPDGNIVSSGRVPDHENGSLE